MKNIYKAIADFQQEVPVILKDTSGFGYKYADLPAIFEVINPLLKKHGLGFTQLVNGTNIQTVLFHVETGETLISDTAIPQGVQLAKMNDFQVLGSAITYIRRYALSSMLGLVTDKDTDASGEQTRPEPVNVSVVQSAKNAIAKCENLEDLEKVEFQISESKLLPNRRTAEGKKIREELDALAIKKGQELKTNEVPFE
jgi:hypothetical protein